MEVGVGLYWERNVVEDLVVVGPGGGAEVDRLGSGAGIELREEEGPQVNGAGTGDSLERSHLEEG